mgnify:CR=1 FL=1
MDRQFYKEVSFDEYCKKCKYKDNKETEYPCDACIKEAINLNTHRPVMYEEKREIR